MFRIRPLPDTTGPFNGPVWAAVEKMLLERFAGISEQEILELRDRLRDPLKHQLATTLLVADDLRRRVRGFAILSHAPDLKFCLLDYIASGKARSGAGVGSALYSRVREHARGLNVIGLFFECLPDDPQACTDPEDAKQNAARLRFYERFGARPVVGTAYEKPIEPGAKDMPHLVYDDLDSGRELPARSARSVIRAVLQRKYGHLCSPAYVDEVVASVRDDPVRIREAKYVKKRARNEGLAVGRRATGEDLLALTYNTNHDIHHVQDRGYVEAPARVQSILDGILPTGLFWQFNAPPSPERHICAVHDRRLFEFLKRVAAQAPTNHSVYPYVFPVRNAGRVPADFEYAAGFYCIDTFTPINRNAYLAARRAVDCTLAAADVVLGGQRHAYALVRPPGHHAERKVFGGFCYFNNAAIAANYMAEQGRVAIVDIDYHHGNGQQDVFYERCDVLTVSIHGHPRFAYPFFSGFAEERGQGAGEGFNLNIPLCDQVDGHAFCKALDRALRAVARFGPDFLVVCLGMDTAKQDPTGTWSLEAADFERTGAMLREFCTPTLVVQEGGYRTAVLGELAQSFFIGLAGTGEIASGAHNGRSGKRRIGTKAISNAAGARRADSDREAANASCRSGADSDEQIKQRPASTRR